MEIIESKFITSAPNVQSCPNSTLAEFAFIGRSNVGKSSLINMLTGRRELAKVSGKPGKTQLINYFLIDEMWHLVDLPGYGYASVSKTKRTQFKKMIDDYLILRGNLVNTFVLVDSNIPLQKIDLEFMNWMGENGLPFSIVYTKSDRPRGNKLEENIISIQDGLKEYWDELPTEFITSAETTKGRAEIISYISNVLQSL